MAPRIKTRSLENREEFACKRNGSSLFRPLIFTLPTDDNKAWSFVVTLLTCGMADIKDPGLSRKKPRCFQSQAVHYISERAQLSPFEALQPSYD